MTEMKTGRLRRRLVLEVPVRTDDDGGGAGILWQETTRLWASIDPGHAAERYTAGRLTSTVSHRIAFRWRPGVLPEMRLRLGERVFHILAVIEPDDRRQPMQVLCEERL